ncbi:MAG: lipoprotein NlpI [Succinivibrionaceae bacterium]|nr:lipoprotein NlpI [Succinivibrionaceae bacterium]
MNPFTSTYRPVGSKSGLWCLALALVALLLGGCAHLPGGDPAANPLSGPFSVPREDILIPEPAVDSSDRDQALIMQLSQMLDKSSHNASDRAELFYELGIVYDRLGMDASARTMFMNALVERPDFGPVYNFVGIYLTLADRFQEANEAFQSALELNPKDTYANLNRGISLYYAHRPQVAIADFEAFFDAAPHEPYRMLWLYFAERETMDPGAAQGRLRERFLKVPEAERGKEWGFNLVRMLLGDLSPHGLIASINAPSISQRLLAEHLCEAYFYLGKRSLILGDDKLAYDYFHLALATRKHDFLEYRYAFKEVEQLRRSYGLPLVPDQDGAGFLEGDGHDGS